MASGMIGAAAGAFLGASKGWNDVAEQHEKMWNAESLMEKQKQLEIEKEKRIIEAQRADKDYQRNAELEFSTNPENVKKVTDAKIQAQTESDAYSDKRFPEELRQKGMLSRATATPDYLLNDKSQELQSRVKKNLSEAEEHKSKTEKNRKEAELLGKEKKNEFTPQKKAMYDSLMGENESLAGYLNDPEWIKTNSDPSASTDLPRIYQSRYTKNQILIDKLKNLSIDGLEQDDSAAPFGTPEELRSTLKEKSSETKPGIIENTVGKDLAPIKSEIPARTRAGTPVKDFSLSETIGVKQLTKSQKEWLSSLEKEGKLDAYNRLSKAERIKLLSQH